MRFPLRGVARNLMSEPHTFLDTAKAISQIVANAATTLWQWPLRFGSS
jgi:hypothetical protein